MVAAKEDIVAFMLSGLEVVKPSMFNLEIFFYGFGIEKV